MSIVYEYPQYSPWLNKQLLTLLRPQLILEYPNFSKWYMEKVPRGWRDGSRKILLARDDSNNRIVGVGIFKKTDKEKKICTLRVEPQYHRQGIGTELMKKALEWLETDKPVITISAKKLGEYTPLFEKFHFEQKRIYLDYYQAGRYEISFNGYI